MGIILDEAVEPASFLEAPSKSAYIADLVKPVLSKVIVALIVLLIGFIAGKFLGKTLHWFLRTLQVNKRWKELTGTNWRIEAFVSSLFSGAIYFLVIIMALTVLGLSALLVNILGFGIISLIFLSLLFAIKDFIPNYMDGLRLYKRIKLHDMVSIDNIQGKVVEMRWTDLTLVTDKGDTLYIPHSLFLKKGFKKIK